MNLGKTVYIFDLDGVILDSMPLHAECWRIYLERLGVPGDGVLARMRGCRNDEIVRGLFGNSLPEDEIAGHGEAKERLYRELLGPQLDARLIPGAIDFLQRHAGVPKGLASNAEPANIDFVLDRAGLRACFDVVVDGHQVARPKPAPDIYLRAAEQLGARPADCVIFEDSVIGMTAARDSGAKVVAINTAGARLPRADFEARDFLDPGLELWLRSI